MPKISVLEKSIYSFILVSVFVGVFLSHYSSDLFLYYIGEDYFVEQATFLMLLLTALLCFYRFFKLKAKKSKLFLGTLLFFGILFLFGAGEEISWGQRIFGTQPGEFFLKYNLQNETNIHNLKIHNISFNLDVFVALAIPAGIFYFILLPYLYMRNNKFTKKIINDVAFCVPKKSQLLLMIFIQTCIYAPGGIVHIRRGELAEFATAGILLCSALFPLNSKRIARKKAAKNSYDLYEEMIPNKKSNPDSIEISA